LPIDLLPRGRVRIGEAVEMVSFTSDHADEAESMFVSSLEAHRIDVPAVPVDLCGAGVVAGRLRDMTGVAAIEEGRLLGYLTAWFPIEEFRGADRTGAYVPEWAHGVLEERRTTVERALYRAASAAWDAAGCDVHAITLLASPGAVDPWFWSGFGMGTVDAIRPMEPLKSPVPTTCTVRRATLNDVAVLVGLDLEHVRHYAAPPVFMVPPDAMDEAAWTTFLSRPGNSAWLAEDGAGPFGFMRFDREFGGADSIESTTGVFISGAYVRTEHRGRAAASSILHAALRHYADEGMSFCAVDFEAFNPEATAFWLRYFAPVCYSLMRTPETQAGRW
jgi:GNAT superfamily N-acetyltransferase